MEILRSGFLCNFSASLHWQISCCSLFPPFHQHRVHEQKDSESLALKLYLVWVLNIIMPNNVVHKISYHSLFPNTGRKRKDRCSHIIVYALYQCFCKVSMINACCVFFYNKHWEKCLLVDCSLPAYCLSGFLLKEFWSMSFLTQPAFMIVSL